VIGKNAKQKSYNHSLSIFQSGGETYSMNCPKCGKEIKDEPILAYCPYCGKPVKEAEAGFKKNLLKASAMLGIFAGVVSALFGYLGFSTFLSPSPNTSDGNGLLYWAFLMGSFGIVAFVLVVSGFLIAIERQNSKLLVIGEAFAVFQGYVVTLALGITVSAISFPWTTAWVPAILAGLLIILPSIIGLILVAISE